MKFFIQAFIDDVSDCGELLFCHDAILLGFAVIVKLFSQVFSYLGRGRHFEMARVEQGHFPMMVNVSDFAFRSDDAVDFISDCPELGFLWCFLFHVFKVSQNQKNARDFFIFIFADSAKLARFLKGTFHKLLIAKHLRPAARPGRRNPLIFNDLLVSPTSKKLGSAREFILDTHGERRLASGLANATLNCAREWARVDCHNDFAHGRMTRMMRAMGIAAQTKAHG